MTQPDVHVAVATDRAYLPWCAVTLLSCVRQTTDAFVHFHLVNQGELTGADLKRLASVVESGPGHASLEPVTVDPADLNRFPTNRVAGGGRISWSRLLLADLLPGLERVIHLDADTLVCTSLLDLWTTDLERRAVGAVPNVAAPYMQHHVRGLGFETPGSYFNAGVLLLDLGELARAAGDIESILADRASDLLWYDQDVLNLAFAGKWRALHPAWNVQNSFWTWPEWAERAMSPAEVGEARAAPAIRHFEGPSLAKPWHYLCQDPLRGQYRSLLRQTPWPDEPLQERTALTVSIGMLPARWQLPAYVHAHRLLDRVGGAGRRAADRRRARSGKETGHVADEHTNVSPPAVTTPRLRHDGCS